MNTYMYKFLHYFIDEDDGDEDGEDFLGKAGDKAHQETALQCYSEDRDETHVQADPAPHR